MAAEAARCFRSTAISALMAAVPELLLQSHAGEIELLPALPAAWPDGSVSGLRARADLRWEVAWQNGRLTQATVRSVVGTSAKVRYGDKVITINLSRARRNR